MSLASMQPGPGGRAPIAPSERRVIFASSLGTVFEWYDLYLYGSLAPTLGRQFFSGLDEPTQLLFALLAFAVGFAVRPFGALVFGRLGDVIGRKPAFLATLLGMGLATSAVAVLPSRASIGAAAPVALVVLRLLQGLSLGGAFGGAAIYVAENAPPGKRGLRTSRVQAAAMAGLLLSLLVILACRALTGPRFEAWGWRVPFLVSLALLAVSAWVRVRLEESPVFRRMKAEGKGSRAPITESFFRWGNLRVVLLVLFGGIAGQAVVWYGGMLYALLFLLESARVEPQAATLMVGAGLVAASPFLVFFGWLSDRIGRKRIVLAGCLAAALTYNPIFHALTRAANPAAAEAARRSPVAVVARAEDCSFLFDPTGKRGLLSSCDVARSRLAAQGIPYDRAPAPPGAPAQIHVGEGVIVPSFEGRGLAPAELAIQAAAFDKALVAALRAAGYPERADPERVAWGRVIALVFLLAFYATMVHAPMAAWLVELFPARIRYTSLSLPYHLGNGWFGGFLPVIAFALVAATGDPYSGLWYPSAIAVATALIGALFVPETKDREISHYA